MARSKMLVFSNPVAGQDTEFNEWYDNVHLGEVLAVPGIVAGERYGRVPAQLPGGDATGQSYLAVYELDADPDEVVKSFQEHAATGKVGLSPALDLTSLAVTVWRARQ
ncbi:hypothetical protein ACFXK0_09120 [Nocardia sp. NPDC059177]|uniref:hypothetical protein n=1 Tax=Nocardia sp. NPDC059177 TaxID=3346759 RepID=UPI00367E05CD